MIYYKTVDRDGKVTSAGRASEAGVGYTEIEESEYNEILSEIHLKVELVKSIYAGVKTIADAPKEWQEEVQRRVDERIKADEEAAKNVSEQEIAEAIGGIL